MRSAVVGRRMHPGASKKAAEERIMPLQFTLSEQDSIWEVVFDKIPACGTITTCFFFQSACKRRRLQLQNTLAAAWVPSDCSPRVDWNPLIIKTESEECRKNYRAGCIRGIGGPENRQVRQVPY